MSDDDRQLFHPDLSPDEARARAVAAVLAEQAARVEARRRIESVPTTTRGRLVVMAVLSLCALYLWFAAPSWVAPAPPPPIPAERVEAGLRLAVYLQAQQVERFRSHRGRLPDVLEETGEPLPGVLYERMDARTFRLQAVGVTGSSAAISYVSTDSLRAFARDADRVVGVRP